MSTQPEIDLTPQNQDDRAEWEWSQEGLFARDLDGRLIRYDAATREELDKEVALEIDGQTVVVKKAVVACDEQGNLKRDKDGQVIPRPTTIYDAVSLRYEKNANRGASPGPTAGGDLGAENVFGRTTGAANNPIPILCHSMYMDPVAVWSSLRRATRPASPADGQDRSWRQAPARVPASRREGDDRQHRRLP